MNIKSYFTKFALRLFAITLPMASISLIGNQTHETTGVFSPVLFASVILFLALCFEHYSLRTVSLTSTLPLLLIITIGFISIIANYWSPTDVIVQKANLTIENVSVDNIVLLRYLKIVYTLIVVYFLSSLLVNNVKYFLLFLDWYLIGFFIGAFFGIWQFLQSFIPIPFWTPFGSSAFAMANQKTPYGLYRVNGGAAEPSNWVPYCIYAISFALIMIKIKGNRKYYGLLVIAIMNLLFTLSGSAFFSIVVIVSCIVARYILRMIIIKKYNARNLLAIICCTSVIVITYFSLINYSDALNYSLGKGLLEKIQGADESGYGRMIILILTMNAFSSSPLIGVGLGMIVSFNTFATILASGGIVLFGVYLWLILACLYNTTIFKIKNDITLDKIGWIVLCAGMLTVTTVSYGEIFSFVSWIWIFLCYNIRTFQSTETRKLVQMELGQL